MSNREREREREARILGRQGIEVVDLDGMGHMTMFNFKAETTKQ